MNTAAEIVTMLRVGTITIGDAIARANQIRLRLEQEDEAHKKRMETPKEYLGNLTTAIHEWLNSNGLQNCKGSDGSLAFKQSKVSVSVADWDVVWANIVATQGWHFLNHSVNKTEVVAFVKENGLPPPGVNYVVTEEVQFRQPRKRGTNGSETEEDAGE